MPPTFIKKSTAMRNATTGFTLVETIISVTLLAVALAGPMTLAAKSLHASSSVRNELIASYLADEGIELVRNLRDNNSSKDTTHADSDWMNNITKFDKCTGVGCVFDVTRLSAPCGGVCASDLWLDAAFDKCGGAGSTCAEDQVLYYNPNTGLYKQMKNTAFGAPWVKSPFSRVIVVAKIDGGTYQTRVTSSVTYPGYRGETKTITVNDDLYNWFPDL